MNEIESPRVTVVIPSFNHAYFIGQAIQSVLDQAFGDFEIIVVDDGSTDGSRDVIDRFGTQVVYVWQENQGLSAARNAGVRMARGEFVGFLDADDMYEPDFLCALVSILDERASMAAAYCGYRFIDQNNATLPQLEARSLPIDQFHQAILDGNFLVPESMLVRRRCFDRIGLFDEHLTACEDWDMWLRISREYSVVGTSKLLTRHRILPRSMSSDAERMLSNRIAVLEKYFQRDSSEDIDRTQRRRRAYGRAYLISSVEFLQRGDTERAFECFSRMLGICPELLKELDTMYELACGDQPKGLRGDFTALQVAGNGLFLIQSLEKGFHEYADASNVISLRDYAYANAFLALGLLSYGARRFGEARFFLVRALRANPRIGLEPQFVTTVVKSYLGVQIVEWLKLRKNRLKAIAGT